MLLSGTVASPAAVAATGWRLYLLVFYSYFAFGCLFQVFPPLFDAVMADFGVSRQTVSLTMSLFMAPLVVFAIPAGFAADRFSALGLGRTAFAVMVTGAVVSAMAGSFPQFLLGRAVSGVGASLLVTSTLKLIAQRIPKARLGLALGIFAAGLPAGTGVAFNLLSLLGRSWGWRAAALAGALITLSGLAVLHWVLKDEPRERGGSNASLNMTLVFRHGEMWRISAVTVVGYMAIISFTTWTPTTLVPYAGLPLWLSSALASLLLVVDIPFAPFWGQLSDRLGKRKVFIVAAFVIYLAGSIVVPHIALVPSIAVPGLLAVIAFMGIGCSMFFPAALAIPAENVGPEQAGAAYGMLFTAQVAGMMAGPSVVAFALEAAGAYMGLLTVSAITLIGLLLTFTLRSR